jgi:hypothetical protein
MHDDLGHESDGSRGVGAQRAVPLRPPAIVPNSRRRDARVANAPLLSQSVLPASCHSRPAAAGGIHHKQFGLPASDRDQC